MEGKIELGDRVKDKITGFTGIAMALSQWLYGCNRINVAPETLDKDGCTQSSQTFDEYQLEIVKKSVVKPPQLEVATPQKPARKTGGPQNDKSALSQNNF